MMDQLEVYDEFRAFWEKWPKETVWHETEACGEGDYINFAFEMGKWRTLVSLFVGPRGGLQQQIYVLNTAKAVDADKVVIAGALGDHDEKILPVIDMREEIARVGRRAAIRLFTKRMKTCMEELTVKSQADFAKLLGQLETKPVSITSMRVCTPRIVSRGVSGRGQSKQRRSTEGYQRKPAHH
ncbi:MAG: hypothetical protein PHV42_03595 [Candidatus Pacebacteria bacterium]|nr:hypothetical protein [Candidatus Paceibacterota bacterium]